MIKFSYEWFSTFLILIYLRFIGEVTYLTEYTNLDYKRKYMLTSKKPMERVEIICREIKHSVKYNSWLILRNYYTYEVTLTKLTISGIITYSSTSTYPRFGGNFFHCSRYPHTRAVNAHIDATV